MYGEAANYAAIGVEVRRLLFSPDLIETCDINATNHGTWPPPARSARPVRRLARKQMALPLETTPVPFSYPNIRLSNVTE